MSLPELSDQDRVWYILKGYEIKYGFTLRGWFLNNRLHREDGPAVEGDDGYVLWYLNGKSMTEEEHRIAINEMMKNGTT